MSNQALLSYLPKRIAGGISYYQKAGMEIEEVRFHRNEPILLVSGAKNYQSGMVCSEKEFEEMFLSFCEQSVYAHTDTIRQGYIAVGGFRVGVCGTAVVSEQKILNVRHISSMNLRFAAAHHGVADEVYAALADGGFCQSVLVYAPPGVGKTTLLRDLARSLATPPHQKRVCVIDSRKEFDVDDFCKGTCIDLLSGYPKKEGIEIATRTLSPQYIVCDEIGNEEDADAVLRLMHAGVCLCASAHGSDVQTLLQRASFAAFHQKGVFDYYCGLSIQDGQRKLHITRRQDLI